jgi:peptidoglycan/LPS O-acetylase OafA/YrhL
MHVYDRRISTVSDYMDYLQKRLARIYPLHLLTLVVAIVRGLMRA